MRAVDHERMLSGTPKDDRRDQVPVEERGDQVHDFLRRPTRGLSLEVRLAERLDPISREVVDTDRSIQRAGRWRSSRSKVRA